MFSANQNAFVICTRVTSLHSCYTFCTRVTEELHSFLSQSELSNFFVYIINKVMQDLRLICICKQKNFSPVLSINSSKKDKALSGKTSKPNFVIFVVYFGNSLLD